MRRALLLLLAVVMLSGSALAEQLSYLDKLPPMIERETFFGDPEIARAQLSPDAPVW